MEAEHWQQRRIQQLLHMRLEGGFTADEATEYAALVEEERQAILALRRRDRPASRSA